MKLCVIFITELLRPTMETFKEMGVNFDKFEEFDIEKMKCRGEGM